MITIQICYDPMTVTPPDTEYVKEQLKEIEGKFNLISIFDANELLEEHPTLQVSNTGIFKAEIVDFDNLTVKTSHLDLVLPSIIRIEELYNEKK